MNFNQLKNKVEQYLTKAQVKEAFGDLRRKETWEAAYASLAESIAATADAAKDAIDTVVLLVDNNEAAIDAAIETIKTAIYWVKVTCYFFYFAGQALGQWYADNQIDAKITAKVEEVKATKAAFCQGHQEGFTVPSWVAKSARVTARINKRIVEGLSLAATPHGLAFVMADLGS